MRAEAIRWIRLGEKMISEDVRPRMRALQKRVRGGEIIEDLIGQDKVREFTLLRYGCIIEELEDGYKRLASLINKHNGEYVLWIFNTEELIRIGILRGNQIFFGSRHKPYIAFETEEHATWYPRLMFGKLGAYRELGNLRPAEDPVLVQLDRTFDPRTLMLRPRGPKKSILRIGNEQTGAWFDSQGHGIEIYQKLRAVVSGPE